jgi:hypothetical protein
MTNLDTLKVIVGPLKVREVIVTNSDESGRDTDAFGKMLMIRVLSFSRSMHVEATLPPQTVGKGYAEH